MTDFLKNFDWSLFLSIKLLLVPTILLAIALVEKKWGTVLGGALSGLPLVSGTLLCFSVFNQSYADYSLSIYGALAGVISLSAMVFTYSRLTYVVSAGATMTLSSKDRWIILIKSLLIYLAISTFFSLIQDKLNGWIASNAVVPVVFIVICTIFNFLLYRKLPKIKPDDNKVNFKFKNTLYMALIGTITFSIFSSIKVYGSASAFIGLLSTAPFYLGVVIFMTHKYGSDHDVLHLSQGILIGFFGYILFFSIFLMGLTLFEFTPDVIVPAAIIITVFSYMMYAFRFQVTNRAEIDRLSLSGDSQIIPAEEINNSLQQQLLTTKNEEAIDDNQIKV